MPDLPLAVALAGLIMMPAVVHHLLTAYADVPLALVWVTGALMLIRWAAEAQRHQLALATLLFAASLAIKQDGVFYDAAIYVGVAVLLLLRDAVDFSTLASRRLSSFSRQSRGRCTPLRMTSAGTTSAQD